MSDIHTMNRRMERFLSSIRGNYHSFTNEVRPDTKGALYSEVQNSEYGRGSLENEIPEEGLIKIAEITYYPEAGIIETKDNKDVLGRVTFKNDLIFEHKSRGKK